MNQGQGFVLVMVHVAENPAVEVFGPWPVAECAKQAVKLRNQRRADIAAGRLMVSFGPVRNERAVR